MSSVLSWAPQRPVEVTNPRSRNDHSLGREKRTLQELAAAVAAQTPTSGDDAVARHVAAAALAHDVADGPRGAWTSSERRHVAVRGNAARRNAPDGGEHALFE